MDDLIPRSKAIEALLKQKMPTPSVIRRVLRQVPGVDAVSRPVVEQIQWERDTAIKQLEEHGIPFCGIAHSAVEKSPCDLCRFNPPSSSDGKPCTMCVAERREENGC